MPQNTPLIEALRNNNLVDFATALSDQDVNIKETDDNGSNLFHIGTDENKSDFINMVLQSKNPRVKDRIADALRTINKSGESAIQIAVRYGTARTHIALPLLDAGADANETYKDNKAIQRKNDSLLTLAVTNQATDIVNKLLEKGADANYIMGIDDGRTALHLAVELGNQEIIKSLINHGARLDIQDAKGNMPKQATTNQAIKDYVDQCMKDRNPVQVEELNPEEIFVEEYNNIATDITNLNHALRNLGLVVGQDISTIQVQLEDLQGQIEQTQNQNNNFAEQTGQALNSSNKNMMDAIGSIKEKIQEFEDKIAEAQQNPDVQELKNEVRDIRDNLNAIVQGLAQMQQTLDKLKEDRQQLNNNASPDVEEEHPEGESKEGDKGKTEEQAPSNVAPNSTLFQPASDQQGGQQQQQQQQQQQPEQQPAPFQLH